MGVWLDRLALGLFRLAGVCLVLMMFTVLAEVGSRTLFGLTGGRLDITFTGGVEMVGALLLAMVLFALPHALDRGQVTVDLVADRLPAGLRRVLGGLFYLGFAGLGTVMAGGLMLDTAQSLANGQTTQDLLLPMALFHALGAMAATLLALRGLRVAVRVWAGGGRPSSGAFSPGAVSPDPGKARS